MTFTGDRSGMLRSRPRGDAEPATPASAAHDGAPRPGDVLELGTEAARPELAAVCTKGLARSPVERFRNGAAFSHALRAYLTDRGITYSPSDCATELRSLGLLAGAPDGLGAAATADDVSTAIANGEHIDKAAPAPGKAEQRRRSRPRVVASVAAAVAAAAILAAGSVKFHSRIPRPSAAPPSASIVGSPAPVSEPATPPEAGPRPVVRTEETPRTTGAPPGVPTETESIVRPKRPVGSRRAAARERIEPSPALGDREPPPVPMTSPVLVRRQLPPVRSEFVDRPTVDSPRSTLPRGTLIAAKLLRALTGPNPGTAEAIVTEEIAADGVVLVPRGSIVRCSARAPADGRVPLSCDSISTSDRVLRFSGIAVGEGPHVGLRLRDDEIVAGTPFVVYVSMPVALR